MKTLTPLDTENLRAFTPFARLSEEQLILLSSRLQRKNFKKKALVLERGNNDQNDYFLVSGVLVLEASDGRVSQIASGTESAASAVAHLRPRQFNVYAGTDVELIVVAEDVLNQMLRDAPLQQFEQAALRQEDGDVGYQLLMAFEADLKANQYRLPSLPDIAFRIRELIESERSTADDVAKVVSADPAIVVKLIKACNSPLYRGFTEVESARAAVVRLGMTTTRQLVTIFSMRELFKTKRKELQEAMDQLWQHSRQVAAIAYVLAELTPGLNRDQALLAGLIHDIGKVPVVTYAEGFVDLWADQKNLFDAMDDLRAEIGVTLLKHWGFSEELQDVVQNAENWTYESGNDKANYTDLVIVSQVHTLIGQPGQKSLPPFNKIPAFSKLEGGGLTPQKSLKILVEARHKIDEILDLLGANFNVSI
ncbi:MAG: HDOD domain-containing protein [Pseudomonadales bacterium]|uniref:Cyclic nucleotide-binding protein n=1 Tax=Oleiphilus messinensis TaxID=141451 RepID=A0A1Y0IFA6_9GAMM|nr:HDOD domain-containing protein [Oleiphilus messinensis]ARU58165.1 cyclic nucleotide-binding protein [Oleiphilus messinensis]MCG8609766.1 HDOD domain-containing protein [Pseudomonadales bacterium]